MSHLKHISKRKVKYNLLTNPNFEVNLMFNLETSI